PPFASDILFTMRLLSISLFRFCFFFFSSRRRHTRWPRDWSSDVCSSDLSLSSSVLSTSRRLTTLDVDNTLLDNDRVTLDMRRFQIGRASCRESVDLRGRRSIQEERGRQ